jgi:deoxycytidine triphosphate deaminase
MSVLGKAEILKRIERGASGSEQVFRDRTWDEQRLRGAAYDIRVSGTYLITPGGTRYWPGAKGRQECTAPFNLHPRDVAFVSSVEVLCMPHDLAGNVATRFRSALEGILVMGGMLIDPGYEGHLHFQLVNIGDEPFRVEPGETSVAAVQFLPVEGATQDLDRIPNSRRLLDQLFYDGAKEPLPQLAFFSDVRTLEGDLGLVERRVDNQEITLASTKKSTDQLLVFGVFLVSITLFAVAIGAIIDALAGHSLADAAGTAGSADLTLPGLAVAAALLVIVGVACYFMMRPLARIVAAGETREGTEASADTEVSEDGLR